MQCFNNERKVLVKNSDRQKISKVRGGGGEEAGIGNEF
jgi:hypothetical protein